MSQNRNEQKPQPGRSGNQQSKGGRTQEGQDSSRDTDPETEQNGTGRRPMQPTENNGAFGQDRASGKMNADDNGQEDEELEDDDAEELEVNGNVAEISTDEDDEEIEGDDDDAEGDLEETGVEENPEVEEEDPETEEDDEEDYEDDEEEDDEESAGGNKSGR